MPDTAILEKIKKLLNMTAANGCTEDEQETALRMAAGLMARHGIEQSQLSASQNKNLAKIGKRISQEFKRYQILLVQAAGELYSCKLVMFSGGKGGIEFIGRPDNIDAAESTMFWLMEQTEQFYKQALPRGMSVSARAKYRKTFKEACALRVLHRVQSLMMDMTRTDTKAIESTGSTALVVQGHFKQLAREAEETMLDKYPNLREGRVMKFTAGSGTYDGQAAGDRVQLRKELH